MFLLGAMPRVCILIKTKRTGYNMHHASTDLGLADRVQALASLPINEPVQYYNMMANPEYQIR